MVISAFNQLLFDFCQINRKRWELELHHKSEVNSRPLKGWHGALDSLMGCYQLSGEDQLLVKALSDPYFPLTKLLKLNVEEFVREPWLKELSEEYLGRIAINHLLEWAKIFLSIRLDLGRLNKYGQVSSMKLQGSAKETIPTTTLCNHCGCCCEIRGGPPEFTCSIGLPSQWTVYFSVHGCKYQRFCPFLFEYFASGRFFCSIYQIKAQCCWEFDREECDFLQKDMAREQAEQVNSD